MVDPFSSVSSLESSFRRDRSLSRLLSNGRSTHADSAPPDHSGYLGEHVEAASASVRRLERELREVAGTQERLLQVVEGISNELTRLGSEVASRPPADGWNKTSRSKAESLLESVVRTVDELQQSVQREKQGSTSNAAQLSHHEKVLETLQRCHAEEFARNQAVIAELRTMQTEESARHQAAIVELQSMCIEKVTLYMDKHESDVADLRNLHWEESARYESALANNQNLVKDISDLRRIQCEEFAKYEPALADIQHLVTDVGKLRSLCEETAKYEPALVDVQRLVEDVTRHDGLFNDLQKLYDDLERHESAIARLQRQDSDSLFQRLERHESARQDLYKHFEELSLCVRGASEREVANNQMLANWMESWQVKVQEEFVSLQGKLVNDLRAEVRTALQSQAAAIKAMDEQLSIVDEQLWQTDKRLRHRIDEVSHSLFAATVANASESISTRSFVPSVGDATLDNGSDGSHPTSQGLEGKIESKMQRQDVPSWLAEQEEPSSEHTAHSRFNRNRLLFSMASDASEAAEALERQALDVSVTSDASEAAEALERQELTEALPLESGGNGSVIVDSEIRNLCDGQELPQEPLLSNTSLEHSSETADDLPEGPPVHQLDCSAGATGGTLLAAANVLAEAAVKYHHIGLGPSDVESCAKLL